MYSLPRSYFSIVTQRCGEERCVTILKTAAMETKGCTMYRILLISAEEIKGSRNYKSRKNAKVVQALRLTDTAKRF